MKKSLFWALVLGLLLASAFGGCSADSGSGIAGGKPDGSAGSSGDSGKDSGLNLDSSSCTPSTCAELGANCGPVTDPKCGGIVQCGTCPAGQTCGGGGVHDTCGSGSNPDACAPLTCADQGLGCGQAGDGCGGTLDCGSCNAPQTCGGDPANPGQCGCTGLCSQVPTCSPGTTTTLTGKVYDPAGNHPLYDVLVYIPNDPSDPGLQPFPPGIVCDVCGATAAGNPLVSTHTLPNGTFTLDNVPVGATIPLVIQLGHWRRQFSVSIPNSCAGNTVPDQTLTMPKNHGEGDIPRIAILSGGLDPVECVLRKIGIQDSEFSNPGGNGHISFYLANDGDPHSPAQGSGARIDSSTPNQAALFAMQGGQPVINQYDMVIVECEGYPQTESGADLTALRTYAESGGRVFASDYAYAWLYNNGNFNQAANWHVNQNGSGFSTTGNIDKVSNPKGNDFQTWLEIAGVSSPGSGTMSIFPAFHNSDNVIAPTQQWLYWGAQTPLHFTWNTPVGAASTQQCGRVVFSDWHAQSYIFSHGTTFPSVCPAVAMTPQEAILEFMIFDLAACVTPYQPVCTPLTCADQGIGCGPAGDGCGGPLDCGPCATGQYCGGGGPGKCGNQSSCTPQTCAGQGVECGQAGDGCGNLLECGNCATGQICGLKGPGKCGSIK
jgi:hypothetical protein